jgi:hypothetical protein
MSGLNLVGCAVVQGVIHQLVTMKSWVKSQASVYRICGRKSGTEPGLPPSTVLQISPVSIIPPELPITKGIQS